jgi:hypothetical protein
MPRRRIAGSCGNSVLFVCLCSPGSFCIGGVFWDGVLQTICLGWLQAAILLISVSWVARIIGVSHRRKAAILFLISLETSTLFPLMALSIYITTSGVEFPFQSGSVVCALNSNISAGWDKGIVWAWEFETSLGDTAKHCINWKKEFLFLHKLSFFILSLLTCILQFC